METSQFNNLIGKACEGLLPPRGAGWKSDSIRAKSNPHGARSLYYLQLVTVWKQDELEHAGFGLSSISTINYLINTLLPVPNLETRRPTRDRGLQSLISIATSLAARPGERQVFSLHRCLHHLIRHVTTTVDEPFFQLGSTI